MPVVITMPKLTDSMEEGRIVEWQVRVGDRVSEGDVLAEIETDKAVMELESFWAGVVAEILRPDGDVVPVGEAIARIAQTGESLAAPPEREARLDQRAEPAGIVAELSLLRLALFLAVAGAKKELKWIDPSTSTPRRAFE